MSEPGTHDSHMSLAAQSEMTARARIWAAVGIGALVTMTRDGRHPFVGVVDDRTTDGSVLWLISPKTGIRKLFHIGDGFTLNPTPR